MDKHVRLGIWHIHLYECKDYQWRYGIQHYAHCSFNDPQLTGYSEDEHFDGSPRYTGALLAAIQQLSRIQKDKARIQKQIKYYDAYGNKEARSKVQKNGYKSYMVPWETTTMKSTLRDNTELKVKSWTVSVEFSGFEEDCEIDAETEEEAKYAMINRLIAWAETIIPIHTINVEAKEND